MIRLTLILLCMLSGAPAAAQSAADPAYREPSLTRLGLGLRIDFGGQAGDNQASLALTSTGEMLATEITLPLLALDFNRNWTRLGTLMGWRLRPAALEHACRLKPVFARP